MTKLERHLETLRYALLDAQRLYTQPDNPNFPRRAQLHNENWEAYRFVSRRLRSQSAAAQ